MMIKTNRRYLFELEAENENLLDYILYLENLLKHAKLLKGENIPDNLDLERFNGNIT